MFRVPRRVRPPRGEAGRSPPADLVRDQEPAEARDARAQVLELLVEVRVELARALPAAAFAVRWQRGDDEHRRLEVSSRLPLQVVTRVFYSVLGSV